VHLVGFIIRIYHDARSPERQKSIPLSTICTTADQWQNTKGKIKINKTLMCKSLRK